MAQPAGDQDGRSIVSAVIGSVGAGLGGLGLVAAIGGLVTQARSRGAAVPSEAVSVESRGCYRVAYRAVAQMSQTIPYRHYVGGPFMMRAESVDALDGGSKVDRERAEAGLAMRTEWTAASLEPWPLTAAARSRHPKVPGSRPRTIVEIPSRARPIAELRTCGSS